MSLVAEYEGSNRATGHDFERVPSNVHLHNLFPRKYGLIYLVALFLFFKTTVF
jgi:hypothetical protein